MVILIARLMCAYIYVYTIYLYIYIYDLTITIPIILHIIISSSVARVITIRNSTNNPDNSTKHEQY